jgi:hypothetical protein
MSPPDEWAGADAAGGVDALIDPEPRMIGHAPGVQTVSSEIGLGTRVPGRLPNTKYINRRVV